MATEQELETRILQLENKLNGMLGDSGLTPARPTLSAWNESAAFIGEGWGLKAGTNVILAKEANTGLISLTAANGWDVILAPTGSNDAVRIQTVIDTGARRILLLNGAWDVGDQIVTFATGTEILGQSKAGTILSWGTVNYNQFIINERCLVGNFTVNTAPTDGGAPPISLGSKGATAWNIAFSSSSGNGIVVSGGAGRWSSILACEFEGLPDANTGQIWINAVGFLLIQGCLFLGASAAGSAIYNKQTGSTFFPKPNIVITGNYGTTKCAQGWIDDSNAVNESTLSLAGNSIAQMEAALAMDISMATVTATGNTFIVPTDQSAAAAMINVSGGKLILTGGRLEASTERTDIIDFNDSGGGHTVQGVLIRGISTNAIHLAGTGDNSVITSNPCPGGDIRIASGSTGNIVALNVVNAVVGNTLLNQIGLNVTGA